MATDETPDPPRYVITGGGTPTPEQLAALAVAMTPVVVEDDQAPSPSGSPGGNWRAAGIREAVGHRTFVALPDLQAGRFPLG